MRAMRSEYAGRVSEYLRDKWWMVETGTYGGEGDFSCTNACEDMNMRLRYIQ